MAKHHRSELSEAKDWLQDLLVQLDELQTRIAKQKRVVAALTELSEIEDDSGPPVGLVSGITDAVRTCLRSAEKPLNPVEIRDRIKLLGIPEQRNMLASVHTIIRRLLDAGEIVPVGDVSVGGGYRMLRLHERMKSLGQRIAETGNDEIENSLKGTFKKK